MQYQALIALTLCATLSALAQIRPTSHFGGRLVYQKDSFTETEPEVIPYAIRFYRGINIAGPSTRFEGNYYEYSDIASNFAWTGAGVTTTYTLYPPVTGPEAVLLSSGAFNPTGGTFVFSNLVANTYVVSLWYVTDVASQAFSARIQGSTVISNSFPGTLPAWGRAYPYSTTLNTNGNLVIATAPSSARLAAIGLWSKITNQVPVVTITSPPDGYSALAPATFTAEASATDLDGTVLSVQFLLNGAHHSADTTAPYEATLTSLEAGNYLLSARGMDDRGDSGTSASVSFTITEPPNLPPVVVLTLPTNGQVYSYSTGDPVPATVISLEATASDPDLAVARVEWFVGSYFAASDTTSPYAGSVGVMPGVYNVLARAVDTDGLMSTSTVATITVTNYSPVNTPPTIQLTSPANGTTFTAPVVIPLLATAVDSDGTVASVMFYQGTSLIGTDSSPPYSGVFTQAIALTFSCHAVATDNSGSASTNSITLTVLPPPNVVPSVVFTSPTNGATFTQPASLTLTATASDVDGQVAAVVFYRGLVQIGTDTTDPYSYAYYSPPVGVYALHVVATDNAGASATNTVNITVNAIPPPNVPPTVSVTSPVNGASLVAPAAFTFSATAADSDGTVASVQFFRGATSLGTDVTSPYSVGVAGLATGSYTLSAVATDDDGATSTSSITITVADPPNVRPAVTITSPASGTVFTAPTSVAIAATASDADGTVAGVAFYAGTWTSTDTTSPYAGTFSITGAGAWTISAVATDDDGAKTTNSVSITSIPAPNQSPIVYIAQPSSGSTFVTPSLITVLATAGDTDGTVSSVSIKTNSVTAATLLSAPYTTTLTLQAGVWTISATATDDDGAASTTNITVTVQDPANTPPAITMTSPASGATYYAPATVVVSADATDQDGSVSYVFFFRNATTLGTNYAAPYIRTNTAVPVGEYWYGGMAADNRGATATNMVFVRVLATPIEVPPTLTLTAPTNGVTFSGPLDIPVAATATADGVKTITGVQFYRGTTSLINDTVAPYYYTDLAVGAGAYVYSAVATDSAAAKSTNQVSVTVVTVPPVNIPPTVYFTSPTNGTTFLL